MPDGADTRGEDIDPLEKARGIAEAALSKKAEFLKVLYVREVTPLADYFVICSGNTARQVKAIADEIDFKLSAQGAYPHHVEGLGEGRWVLMDYGDVVVHVFEAETRTYYNLEGLWDDAVEVTL